MSSWRTASRLILVLTFCSAASLAAPLQQDISLDAQHWASHASAREKQPPRFAFKRQEGFPQGLVAVSQGAVELQHFDFASGTIEFDMKQTGDDLPGIRFRLAGSGTGEDAEEFYLRPSGDCRASNDCVQYAPIIHGFMLWNVFPQYQSQATVFDGWNHYKLVISGNRMNVYVNHLPEPVLRVGQLESNSTHGTVALVGPAVFANLVLKPGQVEGLPASATLDPSSADGGIVRQWELGSPSALHFGKAPTFDEAPSQQPWKQIHAERFGFVNLNRVYQAGEVPSEITWLRFMVWSDRAQTKELSLGWLGQIWVFANGSFVTAKKNFYYPESERQQPDGRYSLSNSQVKLGLKQGMNVITFALHDSVRDSAASRTGYGWGMGARFDDPSAIRFLAGGHG